MEKNEIKKKKKKARKKSPEGREIFSPALQQNGYYGPTLIDGQLTQRKLTKEEELIKKKYKKID